ncbi:MAG: hypothetical protein NZ899_06860 [Thermoguttaceae bacterium]|nr:hypothetical protein [Thermoguttaceae bacterium]
MRGIIAGLSVLAFLCIVPPPVLGENQSGRAPRDLPPVDKPPVQTALEDAPLKATQSASGEVSSVTTLGKAGNILRWLAPQLENGSGLMSTGARAGLASDNSIRPAELPPRSGLARVPSGQAILFTPPAETGDGSGAKMAGGHLPTQEIFSSPARTALEGDPFTNPFGDPQGDQESSGHQARSLAKLPVEEVASPQAVVGAREMSAISGSVDESRSRRIMSTDRAKLEFVLPADSDVVSPSEGSFVPLWVVMAEGQQASPSQTELPAPPEQPEIKSTKPLADQLAAGPRVSPDVCPKPASYDQELPEGLAPIGSLSHEIPAGQGRLPVLCPMSTEERSAPVSRGWEPVTFMWKASALCHKPAYFEQVHVERYGHSVGPLLQPLVSGAHFFLTVPILPYKMGLYPPTECIYTLGHYRPGSCAPYMLDPLPISLRAALMQAGAWTAGVFVVP